MTSIEKDGRYFDFDDTIILSKQIKALDAITSTSTFSYQSTLQDTANNRDILGIQNWDAVKPIYKNVIVTLHFGSVNMIANMRVEGLDDGIQFSLFTDSYDVFNLLTGSLKDVQFRNYPFGTLADRRANTSGYVDFLINNGTNKFDLNGSFFLNLVTSLYVKDIIQDIFNALGVKLSGDILNDWRYNHLFLTNDSVYIEYDEAYIDEHTFFVGKQVNQSITGATIITFPLESGIFYDPQGWWSTSVLTVDMSRSLGWEINLQFNNPGEHVIEVYDNVAATAVDSITLDASQNSISWSSVGTFVPSRNYSIRVTPVLGTIIMSSSSTAKFFVVNEAYKNEVLLRFTFDEMLPRFIVPEMDTRDFVTQIFSMFNPIIDYNPSSRELSVNFFNKIKERAEEDWSDYIESYTIDTISLVDEYAKRNFILYDDGDEQFIEDYNKRMPVPYGGGLMEVDNDFIEEENDLLTVEFTPSLQELNNAAQAYLPTMQYFDEDGNEDKFSHRLLLGVVNYSVQNFSSLTSINGISAMPYGWFAKPDVGRPVDGIKLGIPFDNPDLPGFTGRTLIQDYFEVNERILSDPIVIPATMYIPERVFHNFDPSTPKRVKTKDFNSLFFVRLLERWESGSKPCEVELIKLS